MESIKNFFMDFLAGNSWFNSITFVLAIIAIILAIYFFKKSNKKKIPTYTLRTFALIENNVRELKDIRVQYLNQEIRNLSITKLVLWNNGKDSIEQNDFAKKGPLKIVIDSNYQILACELLYQKNTQNDFRISLNNDKKAIAINFDYFGYLEGVVVQIFHTGKDSSHITVEGQLRSNQKIVRRVRNHIIPQYLNLATYMVKNNPKLLRKIVGWSIIFLCSLVVVFSIYKCFMSEEMFLQYIQVERSLFLNVSVVAMYLLLIRFGVMILKDRIPCGFDIFEKDFNDN